MSQLEQPKCCRCRFWQRYIDTTYLGFKVPAGWGGCYKKAPSFWIDEENIHRNVFPATHSEQWCGEFEVSPYINYRRSLRNLDLSKLKSEEELAIKPLSGERVKRVMDSLESFGIYRINQWLMTSESQRLHVPELGRKALYLINEAVRQAIQDGLATKDVEETRLSNLE